MPELPNEIEVVDQATGKRRMFEPRFTLGNVGSIIATALFGAAIYFGIIGKIETQASDIAQLQAAVAPIPAMSAHVQIIDNTITLNKASRDKQNDDMSARLDRLTESVNALAQTVAGLTATIQAQQDRRP